MTDTQPLRALNLESGVGTDDSPGERPIDPWSEELLELLAAAGVEPRTSVLDAACGSGEVALQAGRLVGPRGRVLGVDRDAVAVELARRGAAEACLGQIEIRLADFSQLDPEEHFDVVVARDLRVGAAEPATLLARLARQVRRGGTLLVIEARPDGDERDPGAELTSRFAAAKVGSPRIERRQDGDATLFGAWCRIGEGPNRR